MHRIHRTPSKFRQPRCLISRPLVPTKTRRILFRQGLPRLPTRAFREACSTFHLRAVKTILSSRISLLNSTEICLVQPLRKPRRHFPLAARPPQQLRLATSLVSQAGTACSASQIPLLASSGHFKVPSQVMTRWKPRQMASQCSAASVELDNLPLKCPTLRSHRPSALGHRLLQLHLLLKQPGAPRLL